MAFVSKDVTFDCGVLFFAIVQRAEFDFAFVNGSVVDNESPVDDASLSPFVTGVVVVDGDVEFRCLVGEEDWVWPAFRRDCYLESVPHTDYVAGRHMSVNLPLLRCVRKVIGCVFGFPLGRREAAVVTGW